MNSKSFCLKRINKDIKEIMTSPLEGIGIISLDNDPMKYIVNIRLMSGIYEGYCIQLLLTFTDNYPISPPKILIYPGQLLDNIYHRHIFKDDKLDESGRHFNKLCFDLLDNDFLSTKSQYSGWNSSYTIGSLLLQVQTFLSEPDMPKSLLPNEEKIEELMKSMDNYENIFKIKKDGEEIIKIHTWKNPYPEIFYKNFVEDEKNKNENEENKIIIKIKEELSCYISRLNYIDDNNILLGYPIKISSSGDFIPIPEMISYDSYIEEESRCDEISHINNDIFILFDDLLNNENIATSESSIIFYVDELSLPLSLNIYNVRNNYKEMKSANNEYYNSWLPIFIDENHFEKNKTTILNFFSILKYGNSGLQKYDFHKQYIFEIMPNLLFETIIKMAEGNISSKLLKCFFQYIFLYKKLIEKNKEFFTLYQYFYLYKNKYNILHLKQKNKFIQLIKDLFFLFFYHNDKHNYKKQSKLIDYLKILKNAIYLEIFLKFYTGSKNHNILIQDLKRFKIFYKIVDIAFLDRNFLVKNKMMFSEMSRNKIIRLLNNNFPKFYSLLDNDLKNEVKKLILNNLDLSKYCKLNSLFFNIIYSDRFSYNSYEKNYKIFLLFNILKNKINEEEFFKNLQNNYGIYLECEDLVKKIYKKFENNKKSYLKEFLYKNDFPKYIKDIIILYFFLDINFPIFKIRMIELANDYILIPIKKECHRTFESLNILIKEKNEACLRHNRSYVKLKRKFSNEEKIDNQRKKTIKVKKIKIKKSSNKIYSNEFKKNYR